MKYVIKFFNEDWVEVFKDEKVFAHFEPIGGILVLDNKIYRNVKTVFFGDKRFNGFTRQTVVNDDGRTFSGFGGNIDDVDMILDGDDVYYSKDRYFVEKLCSRLPIKSYISKAGADWDCIKDWGAVDECVVKIIDKIKEVTGANRYVDWDAVWDEWVIGLSVSSGGLFYKVVRV